MKFNLVGPDPPLAYGVSCRDVPSSLVKLMSAGDYTSVGLGEVQVDARKYVHFARDIIAGAMRGYRNPTAWFMRKLDSEG